MIRQFIRTNPDAFTAVIGCYAQMGAESVARIPGVDLILGNQEKLNLLQYVGSGKNPSPVVVRDRILRDDFTIAFVSGSGPLDRRAHLKIQEGCNFMCSFCIIPFARGRVRSRELDNLLDEARELVRRGAKEIVLTGVNLGTYGHVGRNIEDVVRALGAVDGLARLRISSIEPTTIPEGIFECMNDPAHPLVPFLHIPAQSGSDAVLKAMHRNYTREDFLSFVRMADARVPGIGIGTDLMVGFPGESEADFEDSCALLEDSPLFYGHIFKYSERPGSAAARIREKVPPDLASRRSARLHTISAEKTRRFCEQHLHRRVEVLFEDCENGHWGGYTGNYLRVAAPSAEDLRNQVRSVVLDEIAGDLVYGRLVP